MDNLGDYEEEDQQQQQEETNVDDEDRGDWRDQSLIIIDTSNSDAEIPNPKKDAP